MGTRETLGPPGKSRERNDVLPGCCPVLGRRRLSLARAQSLPVASPRMQAPVITYWRAMTQVMWFSAALGFACPFQRMTARFAAIGLVPQKKRTRRFAFGGWH